MFVGSISAAMRQVLAQALPAFAGREAVIGCSGNFTCEAVLSLQALSIPIHSNDVSLYSSLLGAWACGQEFALTLADPEYAWLTPFLDTTERQLATVMVLLDMLPFVKQKHAHQQRFWQNYRTQFPILVDETIARLGKVQLRVTSFFCGDILAHFERFADNPRAVFCCFAPTYASGYERLYKRLDALFTWGRPSYPLLDDTRRDTLRAWMRERAYLWYDDRVLPDEAPILSQQRGRLKTAYLYSNVLPTPTLLKPVFLPAPRWPLASAATQFRADSIVTVCPISTSHLHAFKAQFLGKAIVFAPGLWAFAVTIDGVLIGFFEYARDKFSATDLYLQADFAVPFTRYARLSKCILHLAIAKQTRESLERRLVHRVTRVFTTAFTDKPVSMKYRGLFDVLKRGRTKEGQAFIHYGAVFTTLSWQETYTQWFQRYSSKRTSTPSIPV